MKRKKYYFFSYLWSAKKPDTTYQYHKSIDGFGRMTIEADAMPKFSEIEELVAQKVLEEHAGAFDFIACVTFYKEMTKTEYILSNN